MKQSTLQASGESLATAIEDAVRKMGERVLRLSEQSGPPSFFSNRGLYGKLMEWSMRDPAFKTQLFRFVDVFPSLKSRHEVERHFNEYIQPFLDRAPALLRMGLKASASSSHLLEAGVSANIHGMARLFMIENRREALVKELRNLHERGVPFTVDLLGETVISEKEADRYAHHCATILNLLANETRRFPPPRSQVNLSVKLSALYSQIHPADPEDAIYRLKKRLRPILRQARRLGAFINFDMEHYALKEVTLSLFRSILQEEEFAGFPDVGLAMQAYLRDTKEDLETLIDWGRRRGQPFTVRLVKGAYWDYEIVIARQRNWPIPVFLRKHETDASFEELSLLLLQNADLITPAFGSHNVRSLAHAITHAAAMGIGKESFEIQVLHGMAEPLQQALVRLGYRVREYCPVGDLVPGMAYLVRRLLENSSNEGFLASRFALGEGADKLLKNPVEKSRLDDANQRRNAARSPALQRSFKNLPHLDFTREGSRTAFRKALKTVHARLGEHWPLVINGRNVKTRESYPSINPTHPSQAIGYASRAGAADADRAVEAARSAAPEWSRVPPPERAAIIEKAASLMEERRCDFAALEVFEAGKNWVESDADVAEAIDFCRFYANEMRRLGEPAVTQDIPGEANTQHWIPRGTGVVIAPWNFPLAILCGMTAAALVTGNTVIMKPAEQTPIIGAWLMEILAKAGLPRGVLNLLTGFGDVGAHLTRHPGIDFIAFTGSKEVGLEIWKTAGQTRPGQINLKRSICEMGGKNAIVVDQDADLDEAVPGVVYSAFGYQGQKCSAASRLILLDEIYQPFLTRLVEATADLKIGDPATPSAFMGPMINNEARQKVRRYIEIGKEEAELIFEGTSPANEGHFAAPVIFGNVSPSARIAREEIFGPVLSVLRASDLSEAIALANETEFALTGGIYSRSPANIERAKREMMTGNVYVNRSITGAIVERQPFGGFHMSGAGTKAGGREYLLNFMFPRVISENRLRHGFAPPEDLT